MKHINLDIVRVTEAAAISASAWIGSGNKEEADRAATDAIRDRLNRIDFYANVAIGEGKKDQSYGLFAGEVVGKGAFFVAEGDKGLLPVTSKPDYELAIDPIEGTTPTVTSGPEAISTIAVGRAGSMHKTSYFYMNKLAYGRHIFEKVTLDIRWPIEQIVTTAAKALGKPLDRMMVCTLNRPRHQHVIDALRKLNVRIKLIQDCDVSGAVASCLPDNGVDILYGIGGAPEAVISAAAIKCLGGDFQGQEVCVSASPTGFSNMGGVLQLEDLIKGECCFVATGITDGSILKGVRLNDRGRYVTNSVFMRSESGTIRWVRAEHGN